jgi:hypothetical protein
MITGLLVLACVAASVLGHLDRVPRRGGRAAATEATDEG